MNYLNYLKPIKNFLIKQKAWIPVLMGLLISMLCARLIMPLNELLGEIIEPLVELLHLDYGVEEYILTLPGNFLTNIIAGLMISFIISGLIYIFNYSNICSRTIKRYYNVTSSKKYDRWIYFIYDYVI